MYHTNIHNMSKAAVGIIIPTWNNPQYLTPLLGSILDAKTSENLFHIYVVNNGHEASCANIENDNVTVINAGDNLGWEGGLKLGLEYAEEPFIMFLNDDTHIPYSERMWLNKMLQHFLDPTVGAVSPSSNVVMGQQNIFARTSIPIFSAMFAIFFCVLIRRKALTEAGGIDDSLPGGDDFDLSIRLRNKGYKIVIDKSVFVYHHGFKTGQRVFGDATKRGGWNSYEYKEKVDTALIQKHGFKEWWNTVKSAGETPTLKNALSTEDTEGNKIRQYIGDNKNLLIVDVGCGGNKTLDNAVGLDMIPKDKIIDTLGFNNKSQADIEHNIEDPLPYKDNEVDIIIARHILEHLSDPIKIVKGWHDKLKKGGHLIIAVPNQGLIQSIPMNIEHLHGWDMESMKTLLEVCGFVVEKQEDSGNNISFISYGVKQ